jgi:alpha-tubulin suppressor-like RCC1 family protein
VSWGCNDDLALGREPNTLPEKQPGSLVFESIKLCTHFLYERLVRIQNLPENDPVVEISCGDCHSAAITSQGKCFIWGCYKVIYNVLIFNEWLIIS